MRRHGRTLLAVLIAIVTVLGGLAGVAPAGAAPPAGGGGRGRSGGLDTNAEAQARQSHFANAGHVGDVVAWPAAEVDENGVTSYYLKDFRLRSMGPHVEVWTPVGDSVSTGLDFPSGDCRNGDLTTITDDQIGSFTNQFENVVRPKLATVFGVPTKRDGKNATIPRYAPSVPKNAYRAPGDRVVVLVDNFRDEVFRGEGPSRAGEVGFVDTDQIHFVDRNVVNLRGLGWKWLLGPNPAPEVVSNDPCTARTAIPSFVEAFLANEYTHILQVSASPDEAEWFNDPGWLLNGESIWAMYFTGYVDPSRDDSRNQMIECFYGELSVHAPNPQHACLGGPAQSLTGGPLGQDPRSLRGARGSFMELLDSRYGDGFISDLLQTTGTWGAAKVDMLLRKRGVATTFNDLVSDWSASIALDGVLDDGARLTGGDAARYQVQGLHAGVAWDSPFTNQSNVGTSSPVMQSFGVSPNGSDFTRLRDGAGAWLDATKLQSLDFDGETHLDCLWTVDPNGHGPGDGALYSGEGNSQNRAIQTEAEVPAFNPTLDFDTKYQTESGYDFGFVQVSTDEGATWTSLAAPGTTSTHKPDDEPEIVAALPGFTGDSGGWIHEHVDLSQYAGQHVRIAFRYRSDPAVALAGYWIDNVTVGGTLISDGRQLAPFANIFLPVFKLQLRLVSYTDHIAAKIADVPLDANNDVHLDASALQGLVAPGAQTVAAIITFIQPNPELCRVRYELDVNGVRQLGG